MPEEPHSGETRSTKQKEKTLIFHILIIYIYIYIPCIYTRKLRENKNKKYVEIAGLRVTSRWPCWWSRTKAFLSAGK